MISGDGTLGLDSSDPGLEERSMKTVFGTALLAILVLVHPVSADPPKNATQQKPSADQPIINAAVEKPHIDLVRQAVDRGVQFYANSSARMEAGKSMSRVPPTLEAGPAWRCWRYSMRAYRWTTAPLPGV
jgi:hypothetical protein